MCRSRGPSVQMSAALSTQFQEQLGIELNEHKSEARSIANGLLQSGMPAEDVAYFDKVWMETRASMKVQKKVPSVLMLVTPDEAEQLMKKPKDDRGELV